LGQGASEAQGKERAGPDHEAVKKLAAHTLTIKP
jgi:hypothetical protein